MASSILLGKDVESETQKRASGNEAAYLLNMIHGNMPQTIQLGGNASIGKGLCAVSMHGSEESNALKEDDI